MRSRANRLLAGAIAKLDASDGPPHDTVLVISEGGTVVVVCECLTVLAVTDPRGGRQVISAYLAHRQAVADARPA